MYRTDSRALSRTHRVTHQTREILFWLCIIWMAAEMAIILWEFLELPYPIVIPSSMPVYYLVLLIGLALIRANARWSHTSLPRKRGGAFVAAWGVFALILHLISSFSNGHFSVPSATFTNLWVVVGVYTGSRFEKVLYLLLQAKRVRSSAREVVQSSSQCRKGGTHAIARKR